MARKSIKGKEVVVVSDDDDEDEDDDDDDDENIRKYIKPVSVYKDLETRSKNNPYFLRRCLNYIIKAKKKKRSNSGRTIRFNYRDVRNTKTLKAEDVDKFSCPFCLMRCGGHEGLRLHLKSSHDAFKYKFYRAEEDHGPEVDVYLKSDTLRFGVLKNDLGTPQLNRFTFCSKHRKGRRRRSQRDDSDSLKRLNARLLELDLDELPHGTENELTHVNDDNVSSPPRAHSLEKTSDILTTTQPSIVESSEPMVPTVNERKMLFADESSESMVPPVSGRKELFAESSEPMVPRVSGRKKLLAESSEPKVPPVSGRKKLLAESSEPKVPPVRGRKKLLAESSEPKVPRVRGRKELLAESSEPKVPPVSGRKGLLAESSEPIVPPVSRRKKSFAESSEPKVPPVRGRKELLAESSEPKVPPVSGRKKLLVESSKPEVPIVSRKKKSFAESSEPKVPPVSGRNELLAESSEPKVPPVSRRKMLFEERVKAKGIERLKSRQFYHSKTLQPMTFEEVMSNEDSENETDDDALDLEERLRLERIADLSKEEKRYMYLWNIFVRKQRVVADGHVPWACEEFTKLHKEEMKGFSPFDWWWRLFRITLWKHGLICANTFNKCTTILRNSDEAGPSTSLRNSDEAGPSTSHCPDNANNQQPMEIDAE